MNEEYTLPTEMVKTSDILGVEVKNIQQEILGKIEEIILDKLTGHVTYVVLSFGGFLGLGGKLFALPWNVIHYDLPKKCFILDIDKDKLENAPGFDKNNWPDMSSRIWGQSIHNYYGIRGNWEDRPSSL